VFDPGISNAGVVGASNTGDGVQGYSSSSSSGVYGKNTGSGAGVYGQGNTGDGVFGSGNIGVRGGAGNVTFDPGISNAGVVGASNTGDGVQGYSSSSSSGVYGKNTGSGAGVYGQGNTGVGMYGYSDTNYGVDGYSNSGFAAVRGYSDRNYGVFAKSNTGYGLYATSYNAQRAALLDGNVRITGELRITGLTIKEGGGSFRIDHPLDPANKYLSHSFVESPDMKNVYDGVVVLDDKGEADIELPDWFGALNKDFRYQLTAIGGPGPNLYISEEISSDGVAATTTTTNSSNSSNSNKNNNINSRFKVAGGTLGMKVSWQVTGIRKDPWANAHRISVEEDKPAKERGYYTYPELYGQPKEKGISHLLFPTDEEEKEELLLINDENKLTT
jgi:hypothetical protein